MEKLDEVLQVLKSIADMVGEMFGNGCEVVIHDLSDIEESIIYILNGQVTGRQIGDTLTDLGLKLFKDNPKQDIFSHYRARTKEGKILRSSSIF